MNDNTCNGWKDRATWNVALWLNNDYGLYQKTRDWAASHKKGSATYEQFLWDCGLSGENTPDGFAYNAADADSIMNYVVWDE